jgi:hypothetical protein
MAQVKMSSTLNTFAGWVAKYPKWDSLKAHLESQEPNVEILSFENEPYVILKSKREDNPEVAIAEDSVSEATQICRSVVWDTASNRPVCVAPFAARRDQKVPMDAPLRMEDFVEGVMINVFRTAAGTRITTRSRLDADGTFYSERTFRELFDEALKEKRSSLKELESIMGEPSAETTATFLSLVLAHPEHRVVRSVDSANLWVIHRGSVDAKGNVTFTTEGLPVSWRPKTYSLTFAPKTWADLKAKFEEIKESKPWYWQGLVVHQGLQRWRFRNGDHDRVRRELRGSESDSFARFLRLRGAKKVQEYLRVYPEDSADFKAYEGDYRDGTRAVYRWYCKCHKEHAVKFKEMPKTVQPLVFGLHKHYLETLRPANKTLRLPEVIAWMLENLQTPLGIGNARRMICDDAAFPDWPERASEGAAAAGEDEAAAAEGPEVVE